MSSLLNRLHPAWLLACVLVACAHGVPAPAPPPARPPPVPVLAVAAPAVPDPTPPQTRWLAVELEGTPVGRTHEVVEGVAGGGFATRVASELRIGRLGKVVEMATDFTLTEDAEGALHAVRGETRLSRQVTTSEVSFAAGAATVRESAGGPVHTRSVAVAGPLLGPEGVRRLIAARLRGAGDRVEYRTWSPALAAPQRVQCTAEDFEAVAVDGAPTRLLRVKVVGDGEGAPRTAWFDAAGRELRTAVALPFGAMVATQARAEPRMPGGELPADVFTRTLIRSNVRLPGPRALDRMVVRVELDDTGQLPPLDGAGERVTAQDARGAVRGAVIEVVRAEPPARGAAESPIGPEYLAASAIIDPSEPAVRAIAAEVSDGAADAWDRAQRLTRWVTDHMTFDAGIAFAPAAELARDRHGTCAGYAVLLASLLRAAHIPARLDMGLVYTGGIFGGHAWVEAWIGGRWVPLDAALPSDGPADAARIALASDALDRGSGPVIAALGVIGHAARPCAGPGRGRRALHDRRSALRQPRPGAGDHRAGGVSLHRHGRGVAGSHGGGARGGRWEDCGHRGRAAAGPRSGRGRGQGRGAAGSVGVPARRDRRAASLQGRAQRRRRAGVPRRAGELQRRLRRHRRLAWAYTVFDVLAANALFAIAAYFVIRSPTLPVLVWSISVVVFTAIALGGAIWSRRDALAASADSTADFVAALRLRLDRRERVPRFVLRLAAAEMVFGLAFYAIWSPEWLGRAARIYGAIALVLAAWWRWYRRRLGRERAQLDALCREPEPGDPDPPGNGGGVPGTVR